MSTSNALAEIFSKFKGKEEFGEEELAELEDAQLDKKLVTWIRSNYEKCKSDRTPIVNQWYVNLAMYKGDQYVRLLQGKLINTPPPPNRVRMMINRIRPAVRTEISRMTSQKPTATVIPASSDDNDIVSAEAGQQTWEHISETRAFQRKLREAAFWTANCGIGYIKTKWDNSLVDKSANPHPQTGEPQGANGDIEYSAPTPFHVLVPNLLEQEIEDQPYVLHIQTMPFEEAKAKWPQLADDEKRKPSVVSTNEIMQAQYLNLKGSDSEAQPDSVLIIEAWIKPGTTQLMPNGGMVQIVDDIVVYKTMDGIPYEHGEYPFAVINNVLSGTFYSTSPVEDMIPIQKEINRSRSQRIEIRNFMSKPGFFVQETSVDITKWTSKPGQLIPVKPGFQMPVPMPLVPVPPSIPQEEADMIRDLEDISGQHQVSKGNAPAGVTAATAISFLQEQDESYMAPTYASIEDAIQKVAKQTLQLAVQYFDEPRLIKTNGSDMSFSTRFLSRADIKNGTDIRIEAGSSLPVSKAARNAMFMDLMGRGLIPAESGLELMNIPNMRSFYQKMRLDENHAIRENMQLQAVPVEDFLIAAQQMQQKTDQFLMDVSNQVGFEVTEDMARSEPTIAQTLDEIQKPMLPVNDWDNHEVHIKVHEDFMKGQQFEMMPEQQREQFIKHVEEHKKVQQSAALVEMMQNGFSGDSEQVLEEAGMAAGEIEAGANNAEGANQFSNIEQIDSQVDSNIQ